MVIEATGSSSAPEQFTVRCATCGWRMIVSRWRQGFRETERYQVDLTHSCEAWKRHHRMVREGC